MEEHFDVAVLGMGPGGEVAASQLLKARKKVAVIERELIGGSCAYWACVPSKTLLRPPEARTAADRTAGVTGAKLDWSAASDYSSFLDLDDGRSVSTDVVIFATGHRPRSKDLGLERAGVTFDGQRAVQVDDHCRAGSNVWAIGDVTGVMPFTHVAKYQGRVVADAILGRPRPATYGGIPRVVFGDPEIAAAGPTQAQAAFGAGGPPGGDSGQCPPP